MGYPYPVETAIFQLDRLRIVMEISRSLFHTTRGYAESFNIYGEMMTFEWPQIESEDDPIIFTAVNTEEKSGIGRRGQQVVAKRVHARDRQDLLPPEIARFTSAFETSGGHHGSHPHLAHEFIRSILEKRRPSIDVIRAANWSAPGICAHESAMKGGAHVDIPSFD